MRNRIIRVISLAATIAGVSAWGCSQVGLAPAAPTTKRPMRFDDLERMKRVSDPQVSPSGKWVMFSATDVDLEKNSKVNHLWVVPMATPPLAAGQSAGPGTASNVKERQLTFWKDGESGGRFSPDGKQVAF